MSGYGLSDAELDAMFEDAPDPHPQAASLAHQQQQYALAMQQQAAMAAAGGPPPMPYQVFPLGQTPTQDTFLTRRVLGVPVWGWAGLVTIAGGGAAAWWYLSQRETKKNDGDSAPALPESTDSGEWGPSRTVIGDALREYYVRKGQGGVLVLKADEAKKRRLPHVSPVITVKCEGKGVIDKDMQRLCKREGLDALVHQDGTIGLYPASGKKGREWKKYIDELRDAGQEA